jgi:hypothetical protein
LSFEVLDCLDSLFRLTKRSPTLDGSVPVRVVRACVPLLEGNAYGFQLTLARPLRLARRLGAWRAGWEGTDARDLERLHRGAMPRLPVEGWVTSSAWRRSLDRGIAVPTRGGIRVFTGLLVRPEAGTWLRVTSAANRRNTLFEVVEQVIPDDGAWVPLVLEIRPRRGAPARLRIDGEVATIAPLRPGVRFRQGALAEAPELAAAHARFYDRAYFEGKKEDVTGRYRRLVAGEPPEDRGSGEAACRVLTIGTSQLEIRPLGPFTGAARPAPEARPTEPRQIDTVVFRNEVAFTALYDGHTMALDYQRPRLREKAAMVEKAFAAAAGDSAREHPGAALYLTRYFTPHPPGEPHFFVKPWAFTQTPPGWSSLLDGLHGDGYDVMRGVVSTDTFFATPAVFRIHREGAPVQVPEGVPLLRVVPVPRSLLAAEFKLRRL